jgi:hypothetical protein
MMRRQEGCRLLSMVCDVALEVGGWERPFYIPQTAVLIVGSFLN